MRIRHGIFLAVVFVLFQVLLGVCIYVIQTGSPVIKAVMSILIILLVLIGLFAVVAPLCAFMMPAVRTISIKDGIIKINNDPYDLISEDYTNIWICTSVLFRLMGTVIFVSDHDAGTSQFYWFGPFIDKEMRKAEKEFSGKLSELRKELYDKYSYDYLCSSSSGNVLISLPDTLLRKFLFRNVIVNFAAAAVFFAGSLFSIHYLPVCMTLLALIVFFVLRGVRQILMHRINSGILLTSAEITQSGIRIGNKFYSFSDGIKIDFNDVNGLLEMGSYMTVTCGSICDKYWLGTSNICRRQQTLLKYTLDMVTSYIDNYGAPS